MTGAEAVTETSVAAPADSPLRRRGFRLVVELARLAPRPLAVAVAGAALFSGCTVLATLVLGRVTDQLVVPTFATGEVPPRALGRSLLAVAAVGLLRATGTIVRRYWAAVVTEDVHVAFRHGLADRYLGLPLAWHHRNPTGQLLSHTESDTEMTADVLGPLPYTFGVLFLTLFSVVALVAADPVLAAVALLIFPALTLLNRVYSRRVEGPAAEVQAGIGLVSAIAHESFDGALVVKTLGREAAEVARFTDAARALQATRLRVGYLRAVFESILDLLPNLGIVVVVLVGALRIRAGAMTPGDLVQVAALFAVLAVPMRIFGYFLESLPLSLAARSRLATVLDEPLPDPPPAVDGPDGDARPAVADGAPVAPRGAAGGREPAGRRADGAPAAPGVVAEGVAFAYEPGVPVLEAVDLRIEPGEVVAVVGSTGAGKSTLCLLLAGLVPPTAGRILVGGRPIDRLPSEDRTDAVALVFQESFLFADTVEANVDLSGGASQADIWRALRLARAETLVEELPAGLHTVLGERGVTLSGGQRQRIALARALIRRPRLLLLDDATSAVDPVVEQEILARLGAITAGPVAAPRTGGPRTMTTVIVAQRRSTIELADRVLYLSNGRIAAAGHHADLLATQPGYEALVRAYEDRLR